jgi:hypothetical protein
LRKVAAGLGVRDQPVPDGGAVIGYLKSGDGVTTAATMTAKA